MNEKLTGDATRGLNIHEKIRVQPLTVKHYNELFLAASTPENSIGIGLSEGQPRFRCATRMLTGSVTIATEFAHAQWLRIHRH